MDVQYRLIMRRRRQANAAKAAHLLDVLARMDALPAEALDDFTARANAALDRFQNDPSKENYQAYTAILSLICPALTAT
jgi:hypothetical protein